MYIGHTRLCVCLSIATCPHYCTDPDVTWGNDRGVPPSCALLGGFAFSAWVSLLWQQSADCETSVSACTLCLVAVIQQQEALLCQSSLKTTKITWWQTYESHHWQVTDTTSRKHLSRCLITATGAFCFYSAHIYFLDKCAIFSVSFIFWKLIYKPDLSTEFDYNASKDAKCRICWLTT